MHKVLIIENKPKINNRIVIFENFELHYLYLAGSRRNNRLKANLINFTEQAINYIKNKNIKSVVGFSDVTSLIASVLSDIYDFKSPTPNSVINCFNKYLTRQKTQDVKNRLVDISNNNFFKGIKYPLYIKAPNSALTLLGFKIYSKEQLEQLLPTIRKELKHLDIYFEPFMKMYLGSKIAKLYSGKYMLFEEIITGKQITIEGYIDKGNIITTVISDSNIYPNTEFFDNFSMPSRLNDSERMILISKLEEDIKKIRLNNSYFNAEYWFGPNNCFKLIEINSRSAKAFSNLYKNIYNFDILKANLYLKIDKRYEYIDKPINHGAQFIFTTDKYNCTASRAFDYKQYSQDELKNTINLFVKPNTWLKKVSEKGNIIGNMELYGNSYEEIYMKAEFYRDKYLI